MKLDLPTSFSALPLAAGSPPVGDALSRDYSGLDDDLARAASG